VIRTPCEAAPQFERWCDVVNRQRRLPMAAPALASLILLAGARAGAADIPRGELPGVRRKA